MGQDLGRSLARCRWRGGSIEWISEMPSTLVLPVGRQDALISQLRLIRQGLKVSVTLPVSLVGEEVGCCSLAPSSEATLRVEGDL